jgi:hypothetical protein
MKALLMHRDRDFEPDQFVRDAMYPYRREGRRQQISAHEQALMQDLELDTLLQAMAGNDEFLFAVARKTLLDGLHNDVETVLYRQDILKDCLKNPAVTSELYNLAVETIGQARKHWWDSHYPSSMLYGALDVLASLLDSLKKLRGIAENRANGFGSGGFTGLFAMLRKELADEYLANIHNHLAELKFRKGVLLSAELGEWNESTHYVLRQFQGKEPTWLDRLFGKRPPGYTFELAERDEAGARILSEMRHRTISRVAIALAHSAGHVVSFFEMLRTELAFYIGCLNLHARLASKGEPVCFPVPASVGSGSHHFRGLYDICLSLQMEARAVGNATNADKKRLVIITGANQGGKSSFLRSIGLAQVMMQCGMFVGAEVFEAELCRGLFTHYKREEDATMKSGKFDEELTRMSQIVDCITPGAAVLFNESFAATNDREGSEIARQIVSALLEKDIKVFFVTHLCEFARAFFDRQSDDAIFLRAERKADGTRTFKLLEGEPLETSYGEDLYHEVFDLVEEVQPQPFG